MWKNNGDIRLSIKFLDENYQTLGRNMLNIDIGKEETEVYYQMDDESLGEPWFISTDELYKLVIEWKEIEDRMYSGEDVFPLTLEDWCCINRLRN